MGKAAAEKTWQLQEARDRLGHLVDEAVDHGPQIITRRGVETVAVIGIDEYRKLADGGKAGEENGRKKREKNEKGKGTFLEFLRNSPLWGVELDIERSKDTGREVDFS